MEKAWWESNPLSLYYYWVYTFDLEGKWKREGGDFISGDLTFDCKGKWKKEGVSPLTQCMWHQGWPHGATPWLHGWPMTMARWYKGTKPCTRRQLGEPYMKGHGMLQHLERIGRGTVIQQQWCQLRWYAQGFAQGHNALCEEMRDHEHNVMTSCCAKRGLGMHIGLDMHMCCIEMQVAIIWRVGLKVRLQLEFE